MMVKKIVKSGRRSSTSLGSMAQPKQQAPLKFLPEWRDYARMLIQSGQVRLEHSNKEPGCSLNYAGEDGFAPGQVVRISIYNHEGQLLFDVDGVLLFSHLPRKHNLPTRRGLVESADWNKQFLAQGLSRVEFIELIKSKLDATIQPSTTNESRLLLDSASLNFMFGAECMATLRNSPIVTENPDAFARFLKHTLARIYQCEPRTNIRLNALSLIDTQSILDSKHTLAAGAVRETSTPTLQMFKRRNEKLEWRHVLEMPPQQYDNISQRPRDLFAIWFSVSNAREDRGNFTLNHTLLTTYQMLALSPKQLYPLSTRRNTNIMAAMNFDNPGATIRALASASPVGQVPESIEQIFFGQPLETGVNSVGIIQTKLLP